MEPNEAREIMAENGVEEGAEFHMCDETLDDPTENVLATITIKSTENYRGELHKVNYELERDGETFEFSETVTKIAGFFEIGSWQPIGGDGDNCEERTDAEKADEEPELLTDGGRVSDNRGYSLEDYPNQPDGEERIVGLNEWGAWAYEPGQTQLRNYKREDGPGKKPLEETYEAEETVEGNALVERIVGLDEITPYGYQLIHEHGGTDDCINALLRAGLSPGQAWGFYGVEIRGNSRNSWASECGYSDHSAVSEAVRKAKRKLP